MVVGRRLAIRLRAGWRDRHRRHKRHVEHRAAGSEAAEQGPRAQQATPSQERWFAARNRSTVPGSKPGTSTCTRFANWLAAALSLCSAQRNLSDRTPGAPGVGGWWEGADCHGPCGSRPYGLNALVWRLLRGPSPACSRRMMGPFICYFTIRPYKPLVHTC